MKFKVLFSTLLALFISFNALAQGKMEDVVYMKNGSIIRGTILEQQAGGDIKIEIMGGSILVYKTEEVDRIVKEPVQHKQKVKGDIVIPTKGFMHMTQLGSQIGSSEYDGPLVTMSLSTVTGYRFFPQLYVAGGMGLDGYRYYGELFMPFFARVGGDVLKKRVTPHYYAGVGYSLPIAGENPEYNSYKGGIMYEGAIGLTVHTRSKVSWVLSLGYKGHRSTKTSEYFYWWDSAMDPVTTTVTRDYRRITVSTGIQF